MTHEIGRDTIKSAKTCTKTLVMDHVGVSGFVHTPVRRQPPTPVGRAADPAGKERSTVTLIVKPQNGSNGRGIFLMQVQRLHTGA